MRIVSEQYARLIAAWKEADDAAQRAQAELDVTLDNFVRKSGPLPTDDQRKAVRELRKLASERLAEALRYIDTRRP